MTSRCTNVHNDFGRSGMIFKEKISYVFIYIYARKYIYFRYVYRMRVPVCVVLRSYIIVAGICYSIYGMLRESFLRIRLLFR